MTQRLKNLWHKFLIKWVWGPNRLPPIKCNMNSNGDRIYHFPKSNLYKAVKIDPMKGERYAHTVQQAEKWGFRASEWKGVKS